MKEVDTSTVSFKSGFVAVAGRPNVGKSTLMNAFIGQKIAAITPRPQTTRRQQFGILTLDYAQIIFMDTPGIHQAKHKLGKLMNQEAIAAFGESDLLLVLVDGSEMPHGEDQLLARVIAEVNPSLSMILALNKIDQLEANKSTPHQEAYQTFFPQPVIIPISATRGDNLDILLDAIITRLPESPPYYPEDQITDSYEREIAADLIREATLLYLRDEVPHSIAIRIDEFIERGEVGAYIVATIFVERDSQKGIVIGKGGKKLKRIGSAARQEIETMSGRNVFLKLRVKLRKNWRNNEKMLQRFGFKK